MQFNNESEFERHIRQLIGERITTNHPEIYALENKKAVDILICRDSDVPKIFFLEIKFHKVNHGRLGIGSSDGRGFQPEILTRKPVYFERNLMWVLGNQENDNSYLLVSSNSIRSYLAGNEISNKHNNIQARIFREERWLDEDEFVDKLTGWLKI